LEQTLNDFLAPITDLLPDERLRRVVPEAVRGILAQETPVIAAMAQSTPRQEMSCYAGAKRIYRFIWNERFNHHQLFKGIYQIAQRTVAEENPDYLVVALDPVNFEKPYTKKLEGVSTVYKSTPPNLNGEARLAHGYPAMTATVVNTVVPAISYLNWFSYKTADFLSENREIQRSIRTTRRVFPGRKLRFVMDSGGDDHIVPMSFGRKTSLFGSQMSSSSLRNTWTGWWKCTTPAWTVGKPSTCKTWSIAFSGKSPIRSPSGTPDVPAWLISKWAGSSSACRKPISSCGSWWLKTTCIPTPSPC
jgi:hypothetical protein